ncbi:MAG: IclR family transcriptional regulator [Acetobacteraceae bacterium]|nr:IclR family transcriptional regulator [Acetobacteraceae bacterium]
MEFKTMAIRGRGVQSVEIAGRILAALTSHAGPMMLRDLAAAAGILPGQAHAYLVSLRKLDLVEQDQATGRYRLGPFALRMGLARLRVSDPLRMASETIGLLSERLGLMVTIAVWGDHGPTVVRIHESATQVHANLRAGTVFSLTGTATGWVFAAFAPPELVEAMIAVEMANPRHSQRVAAGMSLADVRAEIAKARAQGYAVTDGKPVPGVAAIAAPVFDHSRQLQLVITAIGPSGLVDQRAESAQIATVLAYTRDLSEQLGYTPSQPGKDAEPKLRAAEAADGAVRNSRGEKRQGESAASSESADGCCSLGLDANGM